MTAHSPTIQPSSSPAVVTAPTSDRVPAADHPGRWLGGAVGALLSLALVPISLLVEAEGFRRGLTAVAALGLLGAPIGFGLGRYFFPQARDHSWQDAVVVGIGLGWLAPPLGAVEIVAGPLLASGVTGDSADPWTLVLLVIAVPVSFIAVVATIPIGVAWGLIVHAIPSGLAGGLRVPAPFDRLGVRHVVLVAVAAGIVGQLLVGPVP